MRIVDENLNNNNFIRINQIKCLIIDNFENNIEEKLFYSILNQSKQLDNFIVINSKVPIKKKLSCLKIFNHELIVLFLLVLILPTDDLLASNNIKIFF